MSDETGFFSAQQIMGGGIPMCPWIATATIAISLELYCVAHECYFIIIVMATMYSSSYDSSLEHALLVCILLRIMSAILLSSSRQLRIAIATIAL